ncbi:hypothetical protein DFH09DRAFT_1070148 [Mycena vulgaris]|nr:hypothetical protein DFH09DRAFT_1070148 [Mycena vulgaris]
MPLYVKVGLRCAPPVVRTDQWEPPRAEQRLTHLATNSMLLAATMPESRAQGRVRPGGAARSRMEWMHPVKRGASHSTRKAAAAGRESKAQEDVGSSNESTWKGKSYADGSELIPGAVHTTRGMQKRGPSHTDDGRCRCLGWGGMPIGQDAVEPSSTAFRRPTRVSHRTICFLRLSSHDLPPLLLSRLNRDREQDNASARRGGGLAQPPSTSVIAAHFSRSATSDSYESSALSFRGTCRSWVGTRRILSHEGETEAKVGMGGIGNFRAHGEGGSRYVSKSGNEHGSSPPGIHAEGKDPSAGSWSGENNSMQAAGFLLHEIMLHSLHSDLMASAWPHKFTSESTAFREVQISIMQDSGRQCIQRRDNRHRPRSRITKIVTHSGTASEIR